MRAHNSRQPILDPTSTFAPAIKCSTRIVQADIVPEIVRQAFEVARSGASGAKRIDSPQNAAAMPTDLGEAPGPDDRPIAEVHAC